ncbi:MAG: helix-turn-helix transcriptional regulator [Saprospiraceae bacterium]|nr:helix-turn-helix transcriptional regulator [Candidatus Vicinibacter affinis]
MELTLREKEVLKLIFEEKNSMEIGQLLHISERTVDGVKAKLLEKTQTRNMVGLVLFCYRNELVNLF